MAPSNEKPIRRSPELEFGLCEVCGCTEANACMTATGPCHWACPPSWPDQIGLCSACAGELRSFRR